MMADNVVEVEGLEGVLDAMKSIQNDVKIRVTRAATRAAANTIRDQARVNARRVDDMTTKEAIYQNIATAYGRKATQATGNMTMRVGVLGGAKPAKLRKDKETGENTVNPNSSNPGGDTFYWRFVEFGTRNVAARPFLRPAMQQSGLAALNAFSIVMSRGIFRALRAQNKKESQ